jgi:hypothetical protein
MRLPSLAVLAQTIIAFNCLLRPVLKSRTLDAYVHTYYNRPKVRRLTGSTMQPIMVRIPGCKPFPSVIHYQTPQYRLRPGDRERSRSLRRSLEEPLVNH